MTLALSAVESNAVNGSFIIYVANVAVLCGSVGNFDSSCVSLANLCKLRLNLCLSNSCNLSLSLDALVALDANLRLYKALSLEHDITVR